MARRVTEGKAFLLPPLLDLSTQSTDQYIPPAPAAAAAAAALAAAASSF